MTIKSKPNHLNGSVQKNQDQKRHVRSNVKVLLTVFFDCNGMVHHEFLPQDRTVNKVYYLVVLGRLCKIIRQKRTELWKNQSWILHHDNAPTHFLAKNIYGVHGFILWGVTEKIGYNKKITVICKFRELRRLDFRMVFFLLVRMSVIYVNHRIHRTLIPLTFSFSQNWR